MLRRYSGIEKERTNCAKCQMREGVRPGQEVGQKKRQKEEKKYKRKHTKMTMVKTVNAKL